MENVSVELYIIGYTMIWIIMLFLYSLPLRLIARSYTWLKKIFNNNKWWWIF